MCIILSEIALQLALTFMADFGAADEDKVVIIPCNIVALE